MLQDILRILESDCRTSLSKISEQTNTPLTEVKKAVRDAEKDRTILKYKAVINWDNVGDQQVWAMIEIKVSPQIEVGFDAIAEYVYSFSQTRTVYLVSGTYDLMVVVGGKTMQEVADFVSRKLSTINGVRSTTTHFVLKRYKEDGEIIHAVSGAKRQPVIL
jgi:DNA-binding Lrp family transcriptional regulator